MRELTPEDAETIQSQFCRLPDIPSGMNTWELHLKRNGAWEQITGLEHVVLLLRKPGRPALVLELGLIDDGRFRYDGLSHYESAGGGVVVVPFLIWHGELYIGLIEQTRALVGGPVETTPRGYAEVGKKAEAQAIEEGREELGEASVKWKALPLKGEPVNPNTSLTNTSRPRPDGTRAGSHFFAREIDPECVEDNGGKPKFKDGAVNPTDPKEEITSWRLAHWTEAMQLHDACPINATARLMATLQAQGRLTVSAR